MGKHEQHMVYLFVFFRTRIQEEKNEGRKGVMDVDFV